MFYVYVHRRADTGAPFYVGKGKGARMRVIQHRNNWWRGIVKSAGGFDAVKVVDGIDEELSHLAEIELIDKYRRLGVGLCNLTDGGEGMSGFKFDAESVERRVAPMRGKKRPDISVLLKGVPKSDQHRKNLSVARTGLKISDEGRAKLSAARKGMQSPMLGKRHRPESIEKIRVAACGEANPFFGKTHTAEVMAKIMAANIGRRDSADTRLRKSIAKLGVSTGPKSDAQKARQRATLLASNVANRISCAHCGKQCDPSNAIRWHGDRCRKRG